MHKFKHLNQASASARNKSTKACVAIRRLDFDTLQIKNPCNSITSLDYVPSRRAKWPKQKMNPHVPTLQVRNEKGSYKEGTQA